MTAELTIEGQKAATLVTGTTSRSEIFANDLAEAIKNARQQIGTPKKP